MCTLDENMNSQNQRENFTKMATCSFFNAAFNTHRKIIDGNGIK